MERPEAFWECGRDELFRELSSGPTGLSSAAAKLRRTSEESAHRKSPAALLASQFTSPIVLLLIAAAVISAFLGDASDSLIVGAIVLASGVLSFRQEYAAGRAVEELLAMVAAKVTLIRDGAEASLFVRDAVAGDVQTLSSGSLIAGDGVLLDANSLQVNESALTGESFPAEKREAGEGRSGAVFKGTFVVSGTGRALLVRVGAETELGAVTAHLAESRPEGSFHKGVREYGAFLVQLTLVLTIFVFAVNVLFHRPVLESFLFSVALAVGLTPQLLPAIMSVTLAQGSRYLSQAKVIAKRLEAIEEFGSMDVLCSDKTGTLTKGAVQVRGALNAQGQESARVLRLAGLTAYAQSGTPNPIDAALLAKTSAASFAAVRRLGEVPYDFSRKRLSVCVDDGAGPTLVSKGAFEPLLGVCSSIAGASDAGARERVLARFKELSDEGIRVLGVATRTVGAGEPLDASSETEMTFEGFLLLEDPLRPDSAATVRRLHEQGVRLKLITGDNRHIAAHAGAAVGLRAERAMTGAEVRALNDAALPARARATDVFSEVEPIDKERVIRALKRAGHTVGYIGDGINDGPAIRAADAGISVASAADVAREAADFVMLEPDLGVLCDAVTVGRRIFANTLKYVFVNTSASFGNMFSMAVASLFLPFLPLLPKQILLINFLTDFPALTIAGDRVDDDMVRRPRRWRIKAVRDFMVVFGLLSSCFDVMTFVVLLLLLRSTPEQFRTGWFIESVATEVLVLLVMRTRKPLFMSRPGAALLWSSLVVLGVCAALPFLPGAGILGFKPLPAVFPAVVFAILVLYVAANEGVKRAFFRRHGLL